MDLEIIILSEVSQIKTNTICYHLHIESKNNYANELIYKIERASHIENKFMVTKGEKRGGINEEFRISRYTLLYIK